MKKELIIAVLAGLLVVMGTFGCNQSSSGKSTAVSRKVHAPEEKQIKDFNQSTRTDRRITSGPPVDRTISGLNGLKID